MYIIGITGTIGAGKGTVVEYLKSKGFTHYSSSGLLKEILTERGVQIDRDAFSSLGKEIRAENPQGGVLALSYERLKRDGVEKAILESIHTIGEADFVRSVGGVIWGVDANIAIRYERIIKRGTEKDHVSYEKFVEQATREDDGGSDDSGHNIRGVIKQADILITNNGTLEELHEQIDRAL